MSRSKTCRAQRKLLNAGIERKLARDGEPAAKSTTIRNIRSKQVPEKAAEAVNTLKIPVPESGDLEREMAQAVLRPSLQAAATIRCWKPISRDLDLTKLMVELQGQARLASNGNLARSEAMLVTQAQTLDAIFNDLARRAKRVEYLSQFEAYLRLGLKAQSQCRATIETLAVIKNTTPATFIRQANVAHGPQQVNNVSQPD